MMWPAPGWEEPSSGAGWDPWSGKQVCSPGGQQGTQASARGPMASVADQGLVLAGQWREGLLHRYMALIRQHPELSPIWGHPIQKKCWEIKDKTSPQGWCSPGTGPREVVGSPSLETDLTLWWAPLGAGGWTRALQTCLPIEFLLSSFNYISQDFCSRSKVEVENLFWLNAASYAMPRRTVLRLGGDLPIGHHTLWQQEDGNKVPEHTCAFPPSDTSRKPNQGEMMLKYAAFGGKTITL